MNKAIKKMAHLYLTYRNIFFSPPSMALTPIVVMTCITLLFLHPTPTLAQDIATGKNTGNQAPISSPAQQDHAHALKLARSGELSKAADILSPYAKKPMANVLMTGDYLVFLSWAGKNQLATRSFEALPAAFPKNAYLLRNMASAYYGQRSYAQAASLYASTLQQNPTDKEAQIGHVRSLYYAGKVKESDNRLNAYLKTSPDSLPLLSIRPQVLIAHGAYAKAWAAQADLLRKNQVSSTAQHSTWEALVTSVPTDKRQAMLAALKHSAASKKETDTENYLLALALHREFNELITSYESAGINNERFSTYTAYWIGWAYFKTDKLKQSETIYRNALKIEPKDLYLTTGLAYVLGKEKQPKLAFNLFKQLPAEQASMAEVRFAKAYIYEQQSDYWAAIKEYDGILAIHPEYRIARKLKLMAMSALGASSQALSQAGDNSELQAYIQGNMAIDRMQWGEFKQSLAQLEPLLQRRNPTGSRFDHIVVLVEDLQMKEAIAEYDQLKAEGVTPPSWVMNSVGSAYIYLEEWEKSLAVYNQQLKTDPNMFNARVGKFYSLSELRRWDEAEELLIKLEKDVIPVKVRSRYTQGQQMEVVVAHGWFLLDQNMMREADAYFTDFYSKAPANTGIRSGLAHTHYFRGWPRKALREFQTITSLESRDLNPGPRVGHALVLNALAHKEEAREMINKHRAKKPKDKHGIRAARELAVDDMRELDVGIVFNHSNDGFNDLYTFANYIHPVTLYTNILTMVNYRRSSQSGLKSTFHRLGVGFDHTFNSDWYMREMLSLDVKAGHEYGARTNIRYTPTDHWIVEAMFDSFTTDVPLRARVAAITSKQAALNITYRESEWREYGIGGSYDFYSDGNRRTAVTARFEQGLYAKKDWRLRLIVDGSLGDNSKNNALYFNPARDWSAAGTLMIEQTVWHAYESMKGYYDRGFIHRLYLTAGAYGQTGFSGSFLGSARYEQEIDFSDTHHLLWGITAGRHSYDGTGVMNYSIDALYRWYF
ncbi:MAG: hypothetical protein Q9M17_03710 [Mariprofundus sp.]|nr:hypothetical protein [Mariprofundus sp.]